ncbi:MAG TPA: YbjQ family protein [Solirubrobacteraceae bacterium]|nr:YbjQ family protein [Solirubrobacteraceae bacterium]
MGEQRFDIITTTANDLPGMVVRENLGLCFGLVVRSVGFAKGMTGSLRSLRQGEVPEYTEVLEDARRHAVDRMIANARLMGANALIACRFDSSEVGSGLTEVLAYGTAVVVDDAV